LAKDLFRSPLEIAIDLKLAPYWGEAKEGEEDFLLPGPGTTTFFGYASVYTIRTSVSSWH